MADDDPGTLADIVDIGRQSQTQRLDAQQLAGMAMVAVASAATVRATRRRGLAAAMDEPVVATAPG